MKLKKGLSLHQMGEEFVVVAEDIKVFPGMVKLNKSGAFVFGLLERGLEKNAIVEEICAKYEVEKNIAERDCERFLNIFRTSGLTEDE